MDVPQFDITKIFNNITSYCRVCMQKNVAMSNIFVKDLESDIENLSERFIYCTGLQITKDDGLPPCICITCLDNLITSHKFKQTCIENDKLFRNELNKLKCEPKTEGFEDDYFNEDIVYNETEERGVKTEKEIECDKDMFKIIEKQITKRSKILRVKKSKRISRAKRKETVSVVNETACVEEVATSEETKQRLLHCEVCSLSFCTKSEAIKHKKTHNDSWICEVCGKFFANRSSHYYHMRSHLPPKYNCDQCDYRTWNKADLRKHILIHSGVKQYQCEMCAASYYVSSNLRSHVRRCHDKLRQHACALCGHRFFDRFKLRMHLDSHNEIKRHQCEVCGSNFSRRCYLKKHLQKNHGVVTERLRPGRQKTNQGLA